MSINSNVFSQFKTIPTIPNPQAQASKPENNSAKEKENLFNLSKSEKTQLAAAGIITLSGIMMFAGRGFIAKRLFKKPELPSYKPLENLVDDTIEQATEVVNNKFGNIITTGFYNANTEEMLNFQKIATGKALKNLSDIITVKYMKLGEIDDKTYLTHIQRYLDELFQQDHIKYNDPDIIIQTSNAYYNTNQKEKAFEILEKTLDKFKDNWSSKYFVNQKIILLGKEKNYQTILDIVKNNKCAPDDDTLLVIMQSIKEINSPAESCEYFEKYYSKNIHNNNKSFNYYLDLSVQNGRKKELYNIITDYKKVSDKKLFKILTENRDKLELDEKTNQIIDLYNELYQNEDKYGCNKIEPELLDKTIEIYQKAKDLDIVTEEYYNNIITSITAYKENPSKDTISKRLLPLYISIQDSKNPFYIKLIEKLT